MPEFSRGGNPPRPVIPAQHFLNIDRGGFWSWQRRIQEGKLGAQPRTLSCSEVLLILLSFPLWTYSLSALNQKGIKTKIFED